MKINNENEKNILHFIFQKDILHIKSSRIPVMNNDVNITYQVMGDNTSHKISYIRFYKEKYIQVY